MSVTLYRTLLNDAISTAREATRDFYDSGEDKDVLRQFIAPAVLDSVESRVLAMLRSAYMTGLHQGFEQAAQAFDEKGTLE
jgi:hypothetical protein